MKDFDNAYDHNKSLLHANKLANLEGGADANSAMKPGNEDLRSLRSEYDYKNKKNFTEVLGTPNKAQQMSRMRQEHANGNGKQSIENSMKSV